MQGLKGQLEGENVLFSEARMCHVLQYFFMGTFYARIPLHACTNNAQLVHTKYTPTVRKTRTLSRLEEGDHSSGGLFGVR